MLFTLVRHKNFGPGVVLSKNDGIIRIYFKDQQIRKILDNSMFFSEEKVNLDEFIRFELYEGIFDEYTKSKAKNYINKEHINRISIQGNKITGIVNGTNQYFVSLVTKNNKIEITCNCPVKGLCKHEYAFFKMLKSNYYKDIEKEITLTKQKAIETDTLSLYKLGNFSSLDSFTNIIDYLSPSTKEIFEEYILIFLKNKSPNFNDLVFYGISPLFFNEKFKEILLSLCNENNSPVTSLINKAYQNFLENYVKPSKSFASLANILNAITCLDITKILNVEKTMYMPSDFIQSAFFYVLKKKDFSEKELFEIAISKTFNHLNFYDFDSDIENIGKNKLAFIKWTKIEDEIFDEFDTNKLIPFLTISMSNSGLISYLIKNFEKIKPQNYQLLVNCLYTSKYNYRYNSSLIDLVTKLPHSIFLFELFENGKN